MGFFMYSNTFAKIQFDIHETIFIFWQSKYILQKYYFDGGQKVMLVSSNEWSLVKKLLRFHQEFYYIVDYLRIRKGILIRMMV